MREPQRRFWLAMIVAGVCLVLPIAGVHAWMAWTFPSYWQGHFGQDLVFALAAAALLVLIARLRLLHLLSIPLALVVYLAWLFLVLGEGVSYYLQADTFNVRFFANLNLANLGTGVRAFPLMIGGGVALFVAMVLVCIAALAWVRRDARRNPDASRRGWLVIATVIVALTVLGVNSAPRRLVGYLTRVQQSQHFADTPQGRAVAALLDLHPVPPKRVVAAPGKNLVLLYLESLENIYWDPKVFPGLTPNLDRLRKQGLDFTGFETFSGANYTIAGMFASQCGVPLFSSPFAGLDGVAGNDNDASTFHPKLTCLGNVLHKAGYTQMYLGGAPITFSNKGMFYHLHHYDAAFGLKQLEAQADGKLAESGWGLYDSELFPLALNEYRKLEAAGKPFNLAMITLDTHPPDGRPSPGCPKYTGSANSMLQAVHCTDYLIGKFIAKLRQQPGWNNTVVAIMSDHLMMRNDAEPLYPKGYHRQPALIVLNAGQGTRPVRMYHMDVAPTLLDLLGVRTNATFIAGEDRSAPNAGGSELVDNAVTDAVLRKALWSRVNEFKLCKKGVLVSATADGGFDVGGRELRMAHLGVPQVGIHSGQLLDFFIDNANAKLVIADDDQQSGLLAARGDASVLTVRPVSGTGTFSVDWLGRHGATLHLGKVTSLRGLKIGSPQCAALIRKVDQAPTGKVLDLGASFNIATAAPPELAYNTHVDFTKATAVAYESGMGWLAPAGWGSWLIGDAAALQFTVPGNTCDGATLKLKLDPYLPPSRPSADVRVSVNGKLATTWHFTSTPAPGALGHTSDKHTVETVAVPINTDDTCKAQVVMRVTRPGALPPPYPKSEDWRALQLRVLDMSLVPSSN